MSDSFNSEVASAKFDAPYLIFLGDVTSIGAAKTGFGIAYWAAVRCAGQMRLPGCTVDIGLTDMDIDAAISAGVRTVVIGVAPRGGGIQPLWVEHLCRLARAGIDIASGLHELLGDIPELVGAAREGGSRLFDVRVPPPNIPLGTGQKRRGKRVLTVGTDCAVGKKYSALALHAELVRRGVKATFRATGQTGIMITGEGIPVDSVMADFIAGAAELMSPENEADHWDIIEGQGALLHPSYAGVSLGLLHGSQPDALVLCHDAVRTDMLSLEGIRAVPDINETLKINLLAARVTNPDVRCIGVCVNTSGLSDSERTPYLNSLSRKLGLPCVDPIVEGVGAIADALLEVNS